MFDAKDKDFDGILKKFQEMPGFEKHRKELSSLGYSDIEIVTVGLYASALNANNKEILEKLEEIIHLMIETSLAKAVAPVCAAFMNSASCKALVNKLTEIFFKELETFKNIKEMEGNN